MELSLSEIELFQGLGVALALGILIGIERGWHERTLREGSRVAGIRTFGIIGLLGGVWARLGETLGEIVLGFGFLAFAGVMILARLQVARYTKDYGTTTVVAAMLTFVLGALAARGEMQVAVAAAVLTAMLLGIKPILHGWIARVSFEELLAVLKLLVMTAVLLPVLPDRGFGPWQALNPQEMWLMVILITGISFLGYVGVRLIGESRGLLLTALAGGLVSSTAVTISYARFARSNPDRGPILAAGIALAAATMFPRTLVVAVVIEPQLLALLAWPLGLASVGGFLAVGMLWLRQREAAGAAGLRLDNPFEFSMALKFGLLLSAIMLLVRAAEAWAGEGGILALALLSGVADVDAINLSLSRLSGQTIALSTAALGIVLACLSNTLVKAGIAIVSGGRALALPVALALGSSLVTGAVGLAAVWPAAGQPSLQ